MKKTGLPVIADTIDSQSERDQLLAWGVGGFYTNDPPYLDAGATYARNDDPFSQRRWYPGMISAQEGGRGYFAPPDRSLDLLVTFKESCEDGRWASIAIMTADAFLGSDTDSVQLSGYNILFYYTGDPAVFRYDGEAGKSPTQVAEVGGPASAFGATVNYRTEVTPSALVLQRVGTDVRVSVDDASYRGGCFTFGARGQRAEFSAVRLSVPENQPSVVPTTRHAPPIPVVQR